MARWFVGVVLLALSSFTVAQVNNEDFFFRKTGLLNVVQNFSGEERRCFDERKENYCEK